MSATLLQAYDDMFDAFNTAWAATGLPIIWPNREGQRTTDDDANSNPEGYAEVFIQHFEGYQATLSDATAGKRWRSEGMLTVSIFTPVASGVQRITLSSAVVAAFRGVTTPNGVIFRRVVPTEVGLDGNYFRTNVIAAFEYDEIA
jgi:hypothetical protein